MQQKDVTYILTHSYCFLFLLSVCQCQHSKFHYGDNTAKFGVNSSCILPTKQILLEGKNNSGIPSPTNIKDQSNGFNQG